MKRPRRLGRRNLQSDVVIAKFYVVIELRESRELEPPALGAAAAPLPVYAEEFAPLPLVRKVWFCQSLFAVDASKL